MTGQGEAKQIASQWGIYSGKYHLLFNIPVAVANSLSSSLIPALSRAVAEKDRKQTLNRIASAIRFSMTSRSHRQWDWQCWRHQSAICYFLEETIRI